MAPLLRMAVLSGIKASVRLHLRLGGAVDAMDDKGRTPLFLAASRGHAEICQILLDAGADLAHVDMEGNDALWAATTKGHLAVAEIIRAAAASVSELPSRGVESQIMEAEEVCIAREPAATGATSEYMVIAPVVDGPTPPDTGITPDGATSEIEGEPAYQQSAEELDLSGWDEEVDTPPPPADPHCTDLANELQKRLSLHVPIDLDEDWGDVDIELPDIFTSARRGTKLDGDEETALSGLVLTAISDGWVKGELLAEVAPRDQGDSDRFAPDFVANLRVMLGDLGVIVDDDPFSPACPSAMGDGDDEDNRLRDKAAEGLAFLRNLNSSGADPLARYIRDLPRDRLTRNEEASLALEIEHGMRAALAAIAMSPAAVSELLSAVEAILNKESLPEDILESDDEGEEDDAEMDSLDVEDVWREVAGMASPDPDPEERLAVAEIGALVRRQLENLSPREAAVIRMRFGVGCEREYTLEEVGRRFGVTRERIRQIEAKAMKKLSHPRRRKTLQGCR